MSKLLIVESPGKIDKLKAILGGGWTVAASVGHIRDLPEDVLGVASPTFRPDYVLTERGRGVAAQLQKLVADAAEIYLATDPDREGESIAWHLQQVLKLQRPHRCTFNDINPGPVLAAVASPRQIDLKLVSAQEARRVLDRLVGYTVTPALSKQSGQRMTAGRVQSPAVRLVVERDRAIDAFQVTEHFGVLAHFPGDWSAEWDTGSLYPDEPHYCLDRGVAEEVSSAKLFTVDAAQDWVRQLGPYPPFTTSTLQQAASVRFKLDPKATMALAQSLYEQGLITYHRTDSPNLSADGYAALAAHGAAAGLPIVSPQRRFKAKADAQEAHEAIRPSHVEDDNAGATDQERALYTLIRQRTLASQMPAASFAVREVALSAMVLGRTVRFLAKGETLLQAGWKAIYGEDEADEPPTTNLVPALAVGQQFDAQRCEVIGKKTRPPKRFTQASLIKELEAQGIGRPSTYASIMDKIQSAGYVVAGEKQLLTATPLAHHLIDSLVGQMAFIELSFTRDMEAQLDAIAEGRATYVPTVSKLHDTLKAELADLRLDVAAGVPRCPRCSAALRRTKGAKGFFWSCAAYPACKTTLPDVKGKPGAPKAPPVISAHACPSCGSGLIHRIKPGRGGYDFWGCSGYPRCSTSVPDKGGAPDLAAARNRATPAGPAAQANAASP